MCGIAGWLDYSQTTSKKELSKFTKFMCDAIVHRGPDSEGVWSDPKAGISLGHRRLAILDLSPSGHQPMISRSGRYAIVFNGEMYNYERLRPQVSAYPFKGTGDTEVLLAMLEKHGIDETVRQQNAFLAMAIWDKKERQLHLVRGRLGKKPLYYAKVGNMLLFGSELFAIRAHPKVGKFSVDRKALHNFLAYKNVPTPLSIYEEVRKVPAASMVTFKADDASFEKIECYWDRHAMVEKQMRKPIDGEAAMKALDSLLTDATEIRMASDVPLGSFLSGGIDSSVIVALMQKLSPTPVQSYAIGFSESEVDESIHAEAVAKHLGTDHKTWILSGKMALDLVQDIPKVYDEPFSDPSLLPTMLLTRKAKEHVTVVLTGDGGDETFGGYQRYIASGIEKRLNSLPSLPGEVVSLFTSLAARGFQALGSTKTSSRFMTLSSMSSPDRVKHYHGRIRRWKTATPLVIGIDSMWEADPYLALKPPKTYRELGMFLDLNAYLPDVILTKVDRASMSVALETRSPLLDYRMTEFAWRLPPEFRFKNGVAKYPLKELAYRYVPKAILDRPKQGFGIPVDGWLRDELKDWASALIDESRLKNEGFFNPKLLRSRWKEHQSGKRDWGADLWTVLMFQQWLAATG